MFKNLELIMINKLDVVKGNKRDFEVLFVRLICKEYRSNFCNLMGE